MESLKIYNTLVCEKRMSVPIEPGRVCVYVCGVTVYGYCRVEHVRVMVVSDMMQCWLCAAGYDVTYVCNITDIDDKIIKRAVENGETMSALTGRFIVAMHEDADTFDAQRPDHEPRATEYVPQMPSMIGRLQMNGPAYQMTDDGVNYAVRKFPGYGKSSGKSLEDLRVGEHMAANDAKQDPFDFVLWKSAKTEEPAESHWASSWGEGYPGWHIECSAMSYELLGEHFDLRGGGVDLQFLHHENEVAQSEGTTGKTFVNTWMYNGLVCVNDEKMSKSLGNSFTTRDVLKLYDAGVARFFILRLHYRNDLNYSDAYLNDVRHTLMHLYAALKDVPAVVGAKPDWNEPHGKHSLEATNDDFNTPVAVSVLFELASEANKTRSPVLASQLTVLAGVLGLLSRDPHAFLQGGMSPNGLDTAEAEARIEERRVARVARDFTRVDVIRADLLAAGIVLEDRPGGVTEWRRA